MVVYLGQVWRPGDPVSLCSWDTARNQLSFEPQSQKRLLSCTTLAPYLDLPLAHDLVHNLVVVLVDLGLVVALLIAQDPQGLRTLKLNLKLLVTDGKNKRP